MRQAVSATVLAAALLAGAAGAADLATGGPAEVMEAAVGTCLENIGLLDSAVGAFERAGWEVDEGGARELSGPSGVSATVTDVHCRVEAGAVGLDEARSIARKLVNMLYPDQFKESGDGACAGYTITTVGGLIELSFGGLGPDAVCPDPAGASILIQAAE